METLQTKLSILETELKKKDWWFTMADDYSDWYRGNEQHKRIMGMITDIGTPAVDLYNKYAPDDRLKIKLLTVVDNDHYAQHKIVSHDYKYNTW